MDSIQIDGISFALVLQSIVILALLWVVYRQGKGLEVSFPASALALFDATLAYAKTQAAKTPTTLDDQVLNVIGEVAPGFAKDKGIPPTHLPPAA